MPPKVSIPILHSITWKRTGLIADNVIIHPDKNNYTSKLLSELDAVIDEYGHNLPYSQIVGALEQVKHRLLNS